MALRVKAEGGQPAGKSPDLEAVREFWTHFASRIPGHAYEVCRLKKTRRTHFRVVAGDDPEAAVSAVRDLDGPIGCYVTLNPVASSLDRNALDAHVVRRTRLMIDVDPVRPADANATDAEHRVARARGGDVREFLARHGFGLPCEIDSGNGYRLDYALDLPNDDAAKDLIHDFLKALAGRFNDASVEIGVECFNAARLCKVPGTWARKGLETAERPHRLCSVTVRPEVMTPVPADVIRRTTAVLDGLNAKKAREAEAEAGEPLPAGKGQGLKSRVHDDARDRYGLKALQDELDQLRATAPGNRNNQLNRSAFNLFQLVAGGVLSDDEVDGSLTMYAESIGLEKEEIQATLDSARKAGAKEPRGVPERNGHAGGNGKKAENQMSQGGKRRWEPPTIVTVSELVRMHIPAPIWAVEGLLSEGLTFLAGKPKLGKSWVALNLGLTIAGGGKALGNLPVMAGDVLYLSLEDRLRRVQDRAIKVLSGLKTEAPVRMHVAVEWPRMGEGGLEELIAWAERVERPTLIIIDVWAKFKPRPGRGNQNAYDVDYDAVSQLKKLADMRNISILVVTHCKKGRAEDAVEEISGTLGQAGSADGILVLTRCRGETDADLFITGRDVEEKNLALSFDPQTFVWVSHGDAKQRSDSKWQESLIAVFKANTGQAMSTLNLATQLEVTNEQMGYFRTTLYRMAKNGLIEQLGNAKFRWPIVPPNYGECIP